MSNPMQPIITDEHGVVRFKVNAVVRYLLDNGSLDLNDLMQESFHHEDLEQFAQLIGYSVDGFASLSYASDVTVEAAARMVKQGVTEEQAKIEALTRKLNVMRDALRKVVPELFQVSVDDLVE